MSHAATRSMRYSPSSLRILEDNCPGALDLSQAGTPMDRDNFAAGTVAHICLEDMANAARSTGRELSEDRIRSIADAAVTRILTDGRSFHGHHEPPPPPAAAFEGRDLAVAWALTHPVSPDSFAELAGAFDDKWQPVAWGANDARFRLVLDYAYTADGTDEEGGGGTMLCVRDYKSSWAAGEKDIDSLQMRAQVVAAVAIVEARGLGAAEGVEYVGVRAEIANLRTRKIHSRDLFPWINEDDAATIARWRGDLSILMDSADHRAGNRPFRPGAGCLRCAYVTRCPAAAAFAEGDANAPDVIARQYVAAQALRDALFPLAQRVTEDVPVDVGGRIVGYVGKPSREALKEAGTLLLDNWLMFGGVSPDADMYPAGAVRGFTNRLGATVTQAKAIAAKLAPASSGDYKTEREQLVWAVTKDVTRPEFGIHVPRTGEEAEGAD